MKLSPLAVGALLACVVASPASSGQGGADSLVFPAAEVTSQTVVVTRPNGTDVGPFPRATGAVNGVATRLHALVDPGGRKNYIVSPVSVAVIVGQLLLAARGETQTRLRALLSPSRAPRRADDGGGDAELHRQLGALLQSLQASASTSESTLELNSGNAFFHQNDLRMNKPFQNDLVGFYRSELTAVDFRGSPSGAQRTINSWVSGKTNGVFDAILPAPLPPSTAGVLINTLYFKAAWLTPFDPELTVTAPFHLNGTHLIDVAYMRGQFDVPYADSDDLRCRLVMLPYKHKDVIMYIIVPHRRVEMDIKEFAETLTPSALATLVGAAEEYSVTVVLPRMSLRTRFSLKEPIAGFRPEDGVSSRLAETEDDAAEGTMWTTSRRNVTNAKPTTSRTPTSKTRRPTPTMTTSQQPPRTTKGQEATQEVETTSKQPPKRPASGYKPTTGRATRPTPRPPPRTTTTPRPTSTTTKGPAGNEFRFDLSGASSDPRFSVEDIVHEISLDVTEVGTEAAAVSVVDVNYSGDIRVIKLDRPFVFFVRHEPSHSNLFWAVITDPTNGDYA